MTEYYRVRLGRLPMNEPAEYSFPTRRAAIKFGTMEAARNPGRVVIVSSPDGKPILTRGRKSQEKRKLRK